MNGWSWESQMACLCTILIGWAVWVTDANMNEFWAVVYSVLIGGGVGFGLSGVRRSRGPSRIAAGGSLFLAGMCFVYMIVAGIMFYSRDG